MSAELRCVRCGESFDEGHEIATVVAWSVHTCTPSASRCRRRASRLTPGDQCTGGGSGAPPASRPMTLETRNL